MSALITNLATNVTAPVNYVMMTGLLSAARKKLPFFNGTLPGTLSKNQGSLSVQWERIENLAVATSALSEPTGNATFFNGRNAVNPTVTRVNVATAKYGNAITLTEEVDLIQPNARAARFLETLGANAGESLNELAVDAYQAVTTTSIRFSGNVASAGAIVTAIADNDIKYAVNRLNRLSGMKFTSMGTGSVMIGSTPLRDSYYGICHPDVEEDIRSKTGFIPVENYASHLPTEPGEFGALHGVRWCTSEIAGTLAADSGGNASTNALRYTTTKTAADVYDSFIYGKEAIGSIGLGEQHAKQIYQMYDRVPAVELIQHAPGSSGVGDPFNEVGSLAWKAWFAMKVLNPSWLVRVRSGASRLD